MIWNLDKDKPICPQLREIFCKRIAKGEVKPGDRLPSVREVAVQAGVNPNTVQKTYEQLELEGIVYSLRGSGWYVSDNMQAAADYHAKLVKEVTSAYFEELKVLGMTEDEVKNYIKEW